MANAFTKAVNRFLDRGIRIDPVELNREAANYNGPLGLLSAGQDMHGNHQFGFESQASILSVIYNRIANDVASAEIRHVKVDENDLPRERIRSKLQNVFNYSANIDQTGSQLVQDIVLTMIDSGCAVLMPTAVETDEADGSGGYGTGIYEMRVGTPMVGGFSPQAVRVEFYNDKTGRREQTTVLKKSCAVIHNPFYWIMNQQTSTLTRLQQVMRFLDNVNTSNYGGKLNLLLQFPHPIRSELQIEQANERLSSISKNLTDHPLGIAAIGQTDHVIQLNRPVDGGLFDQYKYFTETLYSQLGFTPSVFNGTATEEEMLQYKVRTPYPILDRITEEITRKFVSLKGFTEGHRFRWYVNMFELTTVTNLSEFIDKGLRNAMFSPNEGRNFVGLMPTRNPDDDVLRNRNIAASKDEVPGTNSAPANDNSPPEGGTA